MVYLMAQKIWPVTLFLLIMYEFDCKGASSSIWEYNAVLRVATTVGVIYMYLLINVMFQIPDKTYIVS